MFVCFFNDCIFYLTKITFHRAGVSSDKIKPMSQSCILIKCNNKTPLQKIESKAVSEPSMYNHKTHTCCKLGQK